MSEFRQDRTSGNWVIIAPERGHRPHSWRHPGVAAEFAASFDPSCPFCPGKERLLPAIIEETPSDEPPRWCIRVVPNKYPAVHAENGRTPSTGSAGPLLAGYGYHEVIIETPRHDADLPMLSDSHVNAVVRTYRHRYLELSARPGIEGVLVFRNHGRRAGASLAHPHSQVIATGITPPRSAALAAWARSLYARHGRCVLCHEVELEAADGRRIVEVTERFLVLVPFAATSPFEQWIVPKRHRASFGQSNDLELEEFSQVLQRALYRLKITLADPAYRFVIESGMAADTDALCSHWRMRIVPDLVHVGGFELGTDLPVNPSLPETDAERLRTVDLVAIWARHQ